jgi:hypothetical protein
MIIGIIKYFIMIFINFYLFNFSFGQLGPNEITPVALVDTESD